MDFLITATDRFFRSYAQHCIAPDHDTLFNMLNALHSLNDKFDKSKMRNLFGSRNFTALKALRNLFHHKTELLHEVKIIPAQDLPPLITDLLIVCLVGRDLIEMAEKETHEKHRKQVKEAFDGLKWYGAIANIQPALFNVAVDVFELVEELDIAPSSDAFLAFEDSYNFEELNGHSHRVTGDIACAAGNVDEVLRKVFQRAQCN